MTHRLATVLISGLLGLTSLPVSGQEVPNLVGTWKGVAEAVHVGPNPYRTGGQSGASFSAKPIEFTFEITEQQDRRFAGQMSGGNNRETIIGSFQPNLRGGIMLDNDGQYIFTFVDPNTIDLCYSHLNPTSRVVACWAIKRSQ